MEDLRKNLGQIKTVDVSRKLILGVAAQEVPDKSKEVFDFATGRVQFQKWSDECMERSGGLSKGNIRVQHDAKQIGGRVTHMSFDDDDKRVDVAFEPTADVLDKASKGMLTGLSMGGAYLRKWRNDETGFTHYTPLVKELSAVDVPCIPTAGFYELIKSDGAATIQPFHFMLEQPDELRKAANAERKAKVKAVLDAWRAGLLKAEDGRLITDQDQAVAVALAEAKKLEKAYGDGFDDAEMLNWIRGGGSLSDVTLEKYGSTFPAGSKESEIERIQHQVPGSRLSDSARLKAIATLADGVMPGSSETNMPVPEQVTDTGGTQPQPVNVGAVEKVEPVLFGDLWKSARGTDGDGDGVLNEGRKRPMTRDRANEAALSAVGPAAGLALGAALGARLMPKDAVANVVRRGMDVAQGAALGFATRNDVRSHATPRLGDGPMAKPGWRTTLDRTLGGAKAGLKAGRAMDGAAQKALDEGVAVAWRRQGGMAANVRPGDAQKLKAALAARDFLTRRTGKLRLGAGIAGAALGAGAAYALSQFDPPPSTDLYKADGRAGRDADGDGKFNEKEGGSGMRTIGAAVGGALAGAALTAAALRTGKGKAAVAAARSASGPLTAAAQRAVKDIGGAAKVIGNSAAGKYAGEQYASFRSMPKLAQLAIGGTALAVTPGGDKLLGLVGLDPNAEWVPGGFRFDLKSKSNGTTVFSQSVRPFADGGVPTGAQYTPPQQQRPPMSMPQPQQAARTFERTGSLMGDPTPQAKPAPAAQQAQAAPTQSADAKSAYSERPQINPQNPEYHRLKRAVEMAVDGESYYKDDGPHKWASHVANVDSAHRTSKDINFAEAQDVVNKVRFSMWSKPKTAKEDYDDLKDHIDVRYSADRDGKSDYDSSSAETFRRADRAMVRYAPYLTTEQKDALFGFINSKQRIPPDFDMFKAAMFDDLYKSRIEPEPARPLLFGDLYKADGRAGRDADGDGKLHEDGDAKGGGGPFHDGRGYSVAAKKRAHETALKAGSPDTKDYADSYHKALIAEDPKYRAENTQVIEERRGRDVWPIMGAKAISWGAFVGGAALGAAAPSKLVGRVGAGALGGLAGAAKGAVGGFVNSTRKVRFGSKSFEMGGKDWASRLGMGAAGAVKEGVGGAYRGARAAGSKPWVNRTANAAVASNLIGWGAYFGVQPPIHFLGEVNDAVRGGARRVEKADV